MRLSPLAVGPLAAVALATGLAPPAHAQTPRSDFAGTPPEEGDPGYLHPAKLRVSRARVLRSDRALDVLAPITSRADGTAEIAFEAAGRTIRFTAPITATKGAFDAVRVRRSIPADQARLGTGIVTVRYGGSSVVRPQEVRLRAASNPARLDVDRIALDGRALSVRGTLTRRASGVVRIEISHQDAEGEPSVWSTKARVGDDGRWRIEDARVPTEVAIAGGSLSVLFTGDFGPRIRGEMVTYQIAPGQTREP